MKIPFLTAHWRDLIVLNFEIDPALLQKQIPRGTELDLFEGKAYVSLVAFRFEKNTLLGIIPGYPAYSFEEMNLRFYIKRGDKRAVAFIKEVVPSRIIAHTAQLLYQEPYVALKTNSRKSETADGVSLKYSWGENLECVLEVEAESALNPLTSGSTEEFILEHYWGYTPQADGSTVEYQVEHPPWSYRKVKSYNISEAVKQFYGPTFAAILSQPPVSAFVAEGSKVSVSLPKRFFHPLKESAPKGWVLYDGRCGFCTWWIPFWEKTINRARYQIAPLQAEWVRAKLKLEEPDLSKDIRLLLNDGTLINGADAYIYGMKQVWWSRPLGHLLGLPILRQLLRIFYRLFNRNRFLVSKVCRLAPLKEHSRPPQ